MSVNIAPLRFGMYRRELLASMWSGFMASGARLGGPVYDTEIAEMPPAQSIVVKPPKPEPKPPAPYPILTCPPGHIVALPPGNADYRATLDQGSKLDLYRGGNHVVKLRELNKGRRSQQIVYRISGAEDGCIAGGAVIGTQSRMLPRGYEPFGNSKCVMLAADARTKNFVVNGMRWDNYWDGMGLAFQNDAEDITIGEVWSTWMRDDWIENDNRRDRFVMEDCLSLDNYMGYSSRNKGTLDGSRHTNTMRGCIMTLAPQPQPPDEDLGGGPNPGHGLAFKLDGRSPKLVIEDCLFAWSQGTSIKASDAEPGVSNDPLYDLRIRGKLANPSDTSNTICWLGNGEYPPGWYVPNGWKLLTRSEARRTLDRRVEAWKAAHPHVYRIPGLDA